ncbi:MAG: ABC transporter substrate-binding protein [Ruminococcus sp.]|nr:ABC transporter substrate-binding protein [Ruminococcus sp.]
MKKKLLAALLTASMVVSLTACGGGSDAPADNSASSADDSAASTAADDSSAPADDSEAEDTASSDGAAAEDTASSDDPWANVDTSEHVVITYMTTGDTPSGTKEKYDEMMAELNAILTEKVNAELDINFISWTDYLSNYNLTLARMDGSVDLVGTASDWLDAWPNAKNGAFLELSEDMLKTYAPKTWASVPAENWELCKYDGEIYLIPEDNYAQWTNHGFIYRLDWAKEAGLADGVHSWEDLTEYFRYVKGAYPDIIPWDSDGTQQSQMAGGWIASHSDFVPIDGISSGGLWGGTRDDLYTVYCPFMTETDSLVEYAKMMKEWDEIGVWQTDVLNNRSSTNRDDYRVGSVAAEQHHTQTWTDLVSPTSANTIYADNPDAETGFFYFGEETGNVTALSITHGAMAISAGSANPERALMVYDLLRNDPDCYRLFCYGIEGVSYEITADGLRATPEGYNQDTDNINGTTNFWWGRNDDLEIPDANFDWDKINALYDEYDKIKIEYPYGQFVADIDAIDAQIRNIQEIHDSYMKQISFGKYSGSAEDIVAEYQAAIEAAGVNEVTAELQRQFDELYK